MLINVLCGDSVSFPCNRNTLHFCFAGLILLDIFGFFVEFKKIPHFLVSLMCIEMF